MPAFHLRAGMLAATSAVSCVHCGEARGRPCRCGASPGISGLAHGLLPSFVAYGGRGGTA